MTTQIEKENITKLSQDMMRIKKHSSGCHSDKNRYQAKHNHPIMLVKTMYPRSEYVRDESTCISAHTHTHTHAHAHTIDAGSHPCACHAILHRYTRLHSPCILLFRTSGATYGLTYCNSSSVPPAVCAVLSMNGYAAGPVHPFSA